MTKFIANLSLLTASDAKYDSIKILVNSRRNQNIFQIIFLIFTLFFYATKLHFQWEFIIEWNSCDIFLQMVCNTKIENPVYLCESISKTVFYLFMHINEYKHIIVNISMHYIITVRNAD